MANLRLEKVSKIFSPDVYALRNVSIEVNDGEFVTILGPTGCGKTTLLRIIAGIEYPTSGKIYIDDIDVTNLPPQKRNVAMVFQDFALYPHMDVYNNISFGLKARGMTKQKIYTTVKKAVNTLLIHKLMEKYPKELSWGQKQRVALARAITREPKIFLFDEPLSNLDARLREVLRIELKRIHKDLKITTLYVTHDQVEAMSLSNKIVVMQNGSVVQVGTPQELYFFPANTFVASFIGTPEINLIEAKIIKRDNNLYIDLKDTEILLDKQYYDKLQNFVGKQVIIGVRPENLYDRLLYEGDIYGNIIRGRVQNIEFLGNKKIIFVEWYNYTIRLVVPVYNEIKINDDIDVVIDNSKIHVFDIETQQRVA